MHFPSEPDPPDQKTSPARQKFIQRIATLPIKTTARDYYIRWAESWTKARGHQSIERTQASSRERDYARASHHYVPLRLSTRQH